MQPLDNDDMIRPEQGCFGGGTGVDREIIDRRMGGLSRFELLQMLDQKLIVECEGVIVIDCSAFGHVEMRMILIVIIL
ncbi:hypothetical protein D3C76_1643850 [compost metagenome]